MGGIVSRHLFALAFAFCAFAAHGAGGGAIVLQVGSDWCESGEDVRKTFKSPAFRRIVRSGGFDLAVYDDMESPTPRVASANKALERVRVPSCRYPAISLVSSSPHRLFGLIENIPFDVEPEILARQINAAIAAHKEAEAQFRLGGRMVKANKPQEAADAYGRGFEILSDHVGELERKRLRVGRFAYVKEWQELVRLDKDNRYGWKMRFESEYGVELVEEANKLREKGYADAQQKFIASIRRIPTDHLTVVQRQCIEMAEYAIVRDGASAKAEKLLRKTLALGRDTVWGQCAMGYLILSGADIEKKEPRRAKLRPRPPQEAKSRSISANALKGRLAKIPAEGELDEAQKSDIALYAALRRVGLEDLNELAARDGAWDFLSKFLKDRVWMEDFAWSGPCPKRALFALESLVYQDGGRWIDGDGPGRRFATAVALEYPDCDEAWLADFLAAYRKTAKTKRLHLHSLTQPVWQWRYAVAPRGSIDTDDPPNQQRFMDKFCNMNVARNGGAHRFVPYRMYNCFGEYIHTAAYYEPWVAAGEWPKRKYTYIIGGVCGELSTFGSICSAAHGLPAIPCGQPGHCAYTRRLLDGSWRIDNNIAPPTTIRQFWPGGGLWTYFQANEGTFEGDREKRHDADRFTELARFAARSGRPAEEVAAFHKRACQSWPSHYGAWSAYSKWLARAQRPAEEFRAFAQSAAAALKGWRQPLWDLLTPYFEQTAAEEDGAAKLAAALVEFAPALRQNDEAIQEEGDFRAAIARWAKPVAADGKLMDKVSMAVLSAQAGTRDYFAQALAWCGDFIVDDKDRLAKLLALADKAARRKKGQDGPARSFLAPLILSAAANGNIAVFRRLSTLQDKLSRYRPKGKKFPTRDFGENLVSDSGLLRTSSSAPGDAPERHAHALDNGPCDGSSFRTDKEDAPWAMVMLPKPSAVKGVVVVNSDKDEKTQTMMTPIEVEVSEDGQNWQPVFVDDMPRETYRVDMRDNKNRYLCVRVRRTPGVQEKPEPFHLAKILVYGK